MPHIQLIRSLLLPFAIHISHLQPTHRALFHFDISIIKMVGSANLMPAAKTKKKGKYQLKEMSRRASWRSWCLYRVCAIWTLISAHTQHIEKSSKWKSFPQMQYQFSLLMRSERSWNYRWRECLMKKYEHIKLEKYTSAWRLLKMVIVWLKEQVEGLQLWYVRNVYSGKWLIQYDSTN